MASYKWSAGAVKWLLDKCKATFATKDVATQSANGLMSSGDKKKLDGVATGANNYTHPGYTARGNGLYKITVDALGHVSGVAGVTKADITNLGIPGQDTTYGLATQSANGLLSSSDKKKLDGMGKPRVFRNVQVAASAWSSGATAAGGVRTRYADVALSGVTANQFVQVVFNPGDIDSYNLASICTVGSGKITIYAESAPGGTMTIPTIVAWPA